MPNVIPVNLGEISSSSAAVNALDQRLTQAETSIGQLETSVSTLEGVVSTTATDEDLLEKLRLASGIRFAKFVPGQYRLKQNKTSTNISTVYGASSYVCSSIPCTPADGVVHLKLNVTEDQGTQYRGAYAFLDSSGMMIGDTVIDEPRILNDETIQIPEGTVTLLVNTRPKLGDYYAAAGGYLGDRIERAYSIGANSVLIQSTQPTSSDNKIWVDTGEQNDFILPTMTDLNNAINDLRAEITDGSGQGGVLSEVPFTEALRNKIDSYPSNSAALKQFETSGVSNVDTKIPTSKAIRQYVATELSPYAGVKNKTVLAGDLDSSTDLVTSGKVKTYVDTAITNLHLGDASQLSVSTNLDSNHSDARIATAGAAYAYTNAKVSELSTALQQASAYKAADTEIGDEPTDGGVPTSKAVKEYVDDRLGDIVSTDFGTAATKDYTDTVVTERHAAFSNGYYKLSSLTVGSSGYPERVSGSTYYCAEISFNPGDKITVKIDAGGITYGEIAYFADDICYGRTTVPAADLSNPVTSHIGTIYPPGYANKIYVNTKINVYNPSTGDNELPDLIVETLQNIPTSKAVVDYIEDKLDEAGLASSSYVDEKTNALSSRVSTDEARINLLQSNVDMLIETPNLAATYMVTNNVNSNTNAVPTSLAVETAVNKSKEDQMAWLLLSNQHSEDKIVEHDVKIKDHENSIDEIRNNTDDSLRISKSLEEEMFFAIEKRKRKGTIGNGGIISSNDDTHICLMIPNGCEEIEIVSNPDTMAMFAFFSEYKDGAGTILSGHDVTIAISRVMQLPVSTGAKYICFNCEDPYVDYTPVSVKFDGVEALYSVYEAMNGIRESSVNASSQSGALGESDWIYRDNTLTIKRIGSKIIASGSNSRQYTIYIKVTGNLYAGSSVTSNFIDANDMWPKTLMYREGSDTKLQLQVRHYGYWASGNIRFLCYGAEPNGNQVTLLASKYAGMNEGAYDEYSVCETGAGVPSPWFIVMEIPSDADFGEGCDFGVWLEDKTDIAALQEDMENNTTLTEWCVNMLSTEASQVNRGMMSAEDKTKLDLFLDANMYMTKYDAAAIYTYCGSVATLNDLPNTASTNDAYYVQSDGATYVFNGSSWDNHGNGDVIIPISDAEIDNLF